MTTTATDKNKLIQEAEYEYLQKRKNRLSWRNVLLKSIVVGLGLGIAFTVLGALGMGLSLAAKGVTLGIVNGLIPNKWFVGKEEMEIDYKLKVYQAENTVDVQQEIDNEMNFDKFYDKTTSKVKGKGNKNVKQENINKEL